ncbi:SUKH-3 domain-containing protein [Deinococcus sp. QL22]|uniref:SUKH-3 domain-containing protein n=1 Tax=Deinococcus sp. QL22 TaxID=2939437 RepID=UPI00201773E5|nr:SUKH-3 domain-containing protein [Deinococcus sp. QL22]UQN10606.1 SUKH-3 domain-containing protein [Deinococcus sp. QL22]
MTEAHEVPWSERLKTYFQTLGWFTGRRVDLTALLAQRIRQGWTPFPAAIAFLEQVEGLGDPGGNYYSAACGPDWHQAVRPLERRIGARLFPIGAEDGWMHFLMDEYGRCYACDLPYDATAFGSLDDLLFGGVREELILRHPSPDQVEWNELNFRMLQYRWGGCDWHDPAYQAMLHRRQALEWRIYRWDHPFAEFKTPYARPQFVK